MATLNVYLGNTHGMSLNWMNVEDATWYFFNESIEQSTKDKFDKVVVKTVNKPPALMPEDLLVYVVPSHAKGVLARRFGWTEKGEDQYGWTEWETKNGKPTEFASEVYVRDLTDDPWGIAKFVWHEALHLKLMEKEGMHKRGGLAGDIYEDTWITPKNAKEMRKALTVQRRIWTGGLVPPTPAP